jgi:hypothetical protein
MILAGGAKCSLCHADGRADLGEIEWPVGICLQEFLEPREDGVVMTTACGRLHPVAFGEASHQDVNELILERPTYLAEFQNIGGVMSKLPNALVNFEQSKHQARRRTDGGFVWGLR